jgi:hypothetical protein
MLKPSPNPLLNELKFVEFVILKLFDVDKNDLTFLVTLRLLLLLLLLRVDVRECECECDMSNIEGRSFLMDGEGLTEMNELNFGGECFDLRFGMGEWMKKGTAVFGISEIGEFVLLLLLLL